MSKPRLTDEKSLRAFCEAVRKPAPPPAQPPPTYAARLLALLPSLPGHGRRPSATPASRLFDAHAAPRRVMIAGLPSAGKTTLLRGALGQDAATRAGRVELPTYIPMIGMAIEEVRFGAAPAASQHCFWACDIGCSRPERMRVIERALVADSDAVVWLVDGSERVFLAEMTEELRSIILCPEGLAEGAPLLVLVNKQGLDVPDSLKVTDLRERLAKFVGTRNWHITGTDGLSGDGVLEAFQWLSDALQNEPVQEMAEVKNIKS